MLATSPIKLGLSSAEVARRRAQGQGNDYQVKTGRSYWEIMRDNVFNLFNIVLGILLVVMLFQHDYTNAFLDSIAVILNILFGLVQEINAKRALEQLAALVIKETNVWREGKLVSIPVNQVVKDDILPVTPGDPIVVDGQILQADSLEMDESLLTGESDAVNRTVNEMLWSGSFCSAGAGLMVATGVGANSTVNKLSRTAKNYKLALTPTQARINALIKVCVVAMLILCPMLILGGLVNRMPSLEIVRNAVVLVSSLVAQGLVLSITLSLLLGAIRISRQKTLVQRINAIEALAHTNVLCFDKTGTLTQNRLAVEKILPLNGAAVETVREQLSIYLGNLSHLNKTASAIADNVGLPGTLPVDARKQQEIPFTSERKWGAITLASYSLLLGAPERLLDPQGHSEALKRVCQLTTSGSRVLAFTRCAELPTDDASDVARQSEPLALIVLSDSVRDDIVETLNSFRGQNIELKVISGDNVETVRTIATQAGLCVTDAYTGAELEAMSESQFDSAVHNGNVFARIEPNTKRRIIASLKHQGYFTAMVGDGVNDVPALKEANLAIAMNDGAQIAKDVADIVLLNNAMSTLPLAFAEGRSITQKIYSTTRLFLVKNFCAVFLIICAGFMMLPFPMSPVQISWLTLGLVNAPSILITFGILRPTYLHSFSREVLNYIFAAASAGTIGGLLLYALFTVILTSVPYALPAVSDSVRSGLFLFLALLGTLIFWQTHGIDLLRPATIFEHRGEFGAGVGFLLITVAPAFVFTSVFDFVIPIPVFWPLLIGSFLVTAIGLEIIRNHIHVTGLLPQRTEQP